MRSQPATSSQQSAMLVVESAQAAPYRAKESASMRWPLPTLGCGSHSQPALTCAASLACARWVRTVAAGQRGECRRRHLARAARCQTDRLGWRPFPGWGQLQKRWSRDLWSMGASAPRYEAAGIAGPCVTVTREAFEGSRTARRPRAPPHPPYPCVTGAHPPAGSKAGMCAAAGPPSC